ncbi:MAG: glycosyltransferase family 2 protein [Planctomycetes bacterium]|nr:glycosyltransferase family 2 protein [Planctomycetota bacterium]
MTPTHDTPELSIVVPALNEEDNVGPLVEEVRRAVIDAGIAAELIVVDDGSTDATPQRLRDLQTKNPWLRVLRRDKARGQSAAMYAGIQAARGRFIATLDADLQNDPADLPPMLAKVRTGEADMTQGLRARRKDSLVRLCTSWVGRTTRKVILGDDIRDTGCTTRIVKASIARQFPLEFKGMHRFMPVYARMVGAKVVEMPVNHRPRVAGVAKYGILNRGFVGFFDCLAMRWMLKRYRDSAVREEPLP